MGVDETPDADVEALEIGDPPLRAASIASPRPATRSTFSRSCSLPRRRPRQTTLHPFFGRVEEAQRGDELLACLGDHVGGGEAAGVVDAVDFLAAGVDDLGGGVGQLDGGSPPALAVDGDQLVDAVEAGVALARGELGPHPVDQAPDHRIGVDSVPGRLDGDLVEDLEDRDLVEAGGEHDLLVGEASFVEHLRRLHSQVSEVAGVEPDADRLVALCPKLPEHLDGVGHA